MSRETRRLITKPVGPDQWDGISRGAATRPRFEVVRRPRPVEALVSPFRAVVLTIRREVRALPGDDQNRIIENRLPWRDIPPLRVNTTETLLYCNAMEDSLAGSWCG